MGFNLVFYTSFAANEYNEVVENTQLNPKCVLHRLVK